MNIKSKPTPVILGLCLLAACASAPVETPLDELGKNDVLVATTGGAAIGASLGYFFGGDDGAKWGAVAGAGAGFVAGKVAKKRRAEFASDAEFLDAEIVASEAAVSTKETQLAALESGLDATRTRIAGFEQQYQQYQTVAKEAEQLYADLAGQIEQNELIAAQYSNSIEYLTEVRKTAGSQSPESGEEKLALEARLAALNQRQAELTAQYDRLNGVNESMKLERERLFTLIESPVKRAG